MVSMRYFCVVGEASWRKSMPLASVTSTKAGVGLAAFGGAVGACRAAAVVTPSDGAVAVRRTAAVAAAAARPAAATAMRPAAAATSGDLLAGRRRGVLTFTAGLPRAAA